LLDDRLLELVDLADLMQQVVVKTASTQAQSGLIGDLVSAEFILLRIAQRTAAGILAPHVFFALYQ
jgi:hypothetical protein